MPMTELTQAEVYSPRSLQVWRTLLNWLAFFFQIFYQILRALGHRPMLSSASSSSSFKPLPVVELPDNDSPPTSALEIPISAPPDFDSDDRFEKLTVRPRHISSIFGRSSFFFSFSYQV
jgi:RNA polymerase II subunit A small phosphatase-like protein